MVSEVGTEARRCEHGLAGRTKQDADMTLSMHPSAAADETRSFALVVLTYRCVMAELCGSETKYRAGAWEAIEAAAPAGEADALFGHVFGFARALIAVAGRPLGWRRTFCAPLCRDELLAVWMIDAAQRGDVAGLLGAAAELMGVEELGDALQAAQTLAFALAQRGLYLCPQTKTAHCDLCPERTLH
jgi:hypothetical protein